MKKIPLTQAALRDFLGIKENTEITFDDLSEMLVKYHIVIRVKDQTFIIMGMHINSKYMILSGSNGSFTLKNKDLNPGLYLKIANRH